MCVNLPSELNWIMVQAVEEGMAGFTSLVPAQGMQDDVGCGRVKTSCDETS